MGHWMARICISCPAGGRGDHRRSRWLDLVDADVVRRQIAGLLDQEGICDDRDWCVVGYEGLPDFGTQPDVDELLAYLDAVDDHGEPFRKLWASGRFDRVLHATEAFADSYQGTYADAAGWAHHYLTLMGEPVAPGMDLEVYGRAAASKGNVRFIDADDGGTHVFWND